MGMFNLDPQALIAQQAGGGNGGSGSSTPAPVTLATRSFKDLAPFDIAYMQDTGGIKQGRIASGKGDPKGPTKSTPNLPQSTTPTTLDAVPNPSIDDFTTYHQAGGLKGFLTRGTGRDIFGSGREAKVDTKGYLDAKLSRVAQIAELSGATPAQVEATRQQVLYDLSNLPTDSKPDELLAAQNDIFAKAEAPFAQQAITNTSTGATTSTTDPNNYSSTYSPEQIAAIQASAASLVGPYAKKAQEDGALGAGVLRELAASSSPAYQKLWNAQASQMQTAGDNIAAAYMNQAAAYPGLEALQARQSMANQIASLQNQVLSNSGSGVSGQLDFNALAGQSATNSGQ